MIHWPAASTTCTASPSARRTSAGSDPTLRMRLPSTTSASFGTGARPDPSIRVPFTMTSVCSPRSMAIAVLAVRRLLLRRAPGQEFLEAEPRQRGAQRPPRGLLSPRQAVVLLHDVRQPLRDREALVLAVGDRPQEARPHVGPVVLRPPAPLRPEQALQ